MASVATNMLQLSLFNQGRKNLIEFCKGVERLSSGFAITAPQDDPSGLSISSVLNAELRGLQTAMQNTQDGMNMLRFADGALSEAQDVLFRMKDMAGRMANEATMNCVESADPNTIIPSDVRDLFFEMAEHAKELKRSLAGLPKPLPEKPIAPAVTFNGKMLFEGSFEKEQGQNLQVGPNSGMEFVNDVVIPSMAELVDNVETDQFAGDFTLQDFYNYAIDQMTEIAKDIDLVSDVRAELGTQIISLEHAVSDMATQFINNSGFKSRITDADMAEAIAQLARVQILNQTTEKVAQQVNIEAILVMPLLNAVFNGMPGGGGEEAAAAETGGGGVQLQAAA